MNTRFMVTLFKDAAILLTFVAVTAFVVISLAVSDPGPARAVLVVAVMTPVIASAAVQLYHHWRAGTGLQTHHQGR